VGRGLAVVGIASTVGFVLLAWLVVTGSADSFDRALTETIHVHISYPLRVALLAFTRLGQGDVMAVASLAAVLACIRRRQRLLALVWALMMSGGFAVTQLLKTLFGRPRPQYAEAWLMSDHSFPSGHTSMTLVVVGFALYLFLRGGRSAMARNVAMTGAALWCGLMGASRLLLGNHYWSDVLGGYLLGTAWLAGAIYCSQLLGTRYGVRS
jgi:undecaprenyl-diphosphatase